MEFYFGLGIILVLGLLFLIPAAVKHRGRQGELDSFFEEAKGSKK
ncbi:hypothetical protein [Proteiniclasticum sediminis]|nr:hypothetical protein [Proteiniclasticum sediminis]